MAEVAAGGPVRIRVSSAAVTVAGTPVLTSQLGAGEPQRSHCCNWPPMTRTRRLTIIIGMPIPEQSFFITPPPPPPPPPASKFESLPADVRCKGLASAGCAYSVSWSLQGLNQDLNAESLALGSEISLQLSIQSYLVKHKQHVKIRKHREFQSKYQVQVKDLERNIVTGFERA